MQEFKYNRVDNKKTDEKERAEWSSLHTNISSSEG